MNKIKLFSHNDLDGFGCTILLKRLFKDDVECENLGYNEINEVVENFFKLGYYKNYDSVFITDISINDSVATLINAKVTEENKNILLLDHHPTALELNKYSWVKVEIFLDKEKEIKTSGTFMLYQLLISKYPEFQTEFLNDFVDTIRQYDTWEFNNKLVHEEEWRTINSIPGYENLYEVSNTGKIRSIKTGKLLKPSRTTHDNTCSVKLSNKGSFHTAIIHTLVANEFLHNVFKYPEINHINGDKTKNDISNIEWVSQTRNRYHAYANKLKIKQNGIVIERVKQLDVNTGEVLKKWDNAAIVERELGIKRSNISKVCDGKDGRTQAGGYAWRWDYDSKGRDFNNYISARDLNTLLYLLGSRIFIARFVDELDLRYTDTDKLLLELDSNKKEEYFKKKAKELDTNYVLRGYKVGIVFAEQYISELGNFLAESNKNLDFIVIINGKTISYRAIRKDINLGEIAKMFGGGGHPAAAGSQISVEKQCKYFQILFE